MHIEYATQAHLPEITPLMPAYHAESPYAKDFPMSPRKIVDTLASVIEKGLMLVARANDGKIAGVLGLMQNELWFTDTPHVADILYYVAPEYRKTPAGAMLKKRARDIVIGKMHVPLLMAIVNTNDLEKKKKFYKRSMKEIGALFAEGLEA